MVSHTFTGVGVGRQKRAFSAVGRCREAREKFVHFGEGFGPAKIR